MMRPKNPYSPPIAVSESKTDVWFGARSQIRLAVCIFVVPTLANYIAWERWFVSGATSQLTLTGGHPFRFACLALLLGLFTLLWFFTLPILRFVARLYLALIRRKDEIGEEWQMHLDIAIRKLPRFAIAASVLWIVWIVGFYLLDKRDVFFSAFFSVVGHVLAATWYVPLALKIGRERRADHLD